MAKKKNELAGGYSPWHMKAIFFVIFDVLAMALSYGFALLVSYEFSYSDIPETVWMLCIKSVLIWTALTIAVLYCFRCYHSIWRFAGLMEFRNLLLAFLILIPVYLLTVRPLGLHFSVSYYVVGAFSSFALCVAHRFSYRFIRSFRIAKKNGRRLSGYQPDHLMIIGAGVAGQIIIRELRDSARNQLKVCCVIDDDPRKKGYRVEGVEIVGDRYEIVKACSRYEITKIIFAIPTCSAGAKRDILNICKETGCKIQVIPGIYQLVNNEVNVSQLRDVDICDLLGREQIRVDNQEVFDSLRDRVVLVTGGGGSIGSELCRQIADSGPRQLVILDIYENNAYDIQQELRRKKPELDVKVLIGSVRNTKRMEEVMRIYRPQIVFHAAAHKHVPLMEDSPCEAIKNNVLGTYKTAQAAEKYGVEKFVLISTDKAVNPTNIMGASKRLCEMVVQMMDRRPSETRFVAVRFGNVLGSNGSVVPLFKRQIAAGGPVTVTDKRVIRYFMTIAEAVALVLQASYYAKGGEIFVLDMGEPVKIDDMARNLIRLSGYRPDVDIAIEYTGLRPGEKLYEELLMDEEGMQDTENRLIHIGRPIVMEDDWFQSKLEELDRASREENADIRALVHEIVPTYQYQK